MEFLTNRLYKVWTWRKKWASFSWMILKLSLKVKQQINTIIFKITYPCRTYILSHPVLQFYTQSWLSISKILKIKSWKSKIVIPPCCTFTYMSSTRETTTFQIFEPRRQTLDRMLQEVACTPKLTRSSLLFRSGIILPGCTAKVGF